METAYAGTLAAQRTGDIHEARVVARGADLGAGVEDTVYFFREHRRGDIGVLDGEGATKPAALIGFGQID